MTKPAAEHRGGASEPLAGENRRDARERFAAERERVGRNPVPRLIELLESEDLRTRFVAEMCLRDATST